jgi:hypothetical protein
MKRDAVVCFSTFTDLTVRHHGAGVLQVQIFAVFY